jgi:predicted metal-binding protein
MANCRPVNFADSRDRVDPNRKTPVADAPNIVKIILLLSGEQAAINPNLAPLLRLVLQHLMGLGFQFLLLSANKCIKTNGLSTAKAKLSESEAQRKQSCYRRCATSAAPSCAFFSAFFCGSLVADIRFRPCSGVFVADVCKNVKSAARLRVLLLVRSHFLQNPTCRKIQRNKAKRKEGQDQRSTPQVPCESQAGIPPAAVVRKLSSEFKSASPLARPQALWMKQS